MKKFLTILLSILSVIVLACGLAACGGGGTEGEKPGGDQTATEYNVTFNYNYENSPAVTVLKTKDGKVQYIENPARTGYTFVKWCEDAEGETAFDDRTLTADITLYAKWDKNKENYTVTYKVGEEVYDTKEVVEGTEITVISYTTDVDKRFNGWMFNGKEYKAGDSVVVNSNITFTASISNLQSIIFVSGEDILKTVYLAKNETITLPTGAELSLEENFLGWVTSAGSNDLYFGGVEFTLDVSDDLIFYARYGGIYTLSFSLGYEGEGELPDDKSLINGTELTLPSAPEREGYRFDGWYDGTTVYSAEADYVMPASDVTLTAQWVKVYTVTFYYNFEGYDEAYLIVIVDENTRVAQPSNPSIDEHKFVNWYTSESLSATFRFTTRINSDTNIYAAWQHKYFTFTLTEDGEGYYVSHAGAPDFSGIPANSMLIIPKSYNRLPVVSLLPVSFSSDAYGHYIGSMGPLWKLFTINSSGLNSPFTSVLIPDTWTEIPDGAFGLCSTLKRVYFEDDTTITRIGMYVFHMCKALEEFDAPSTVTELGEGAFNNCSALVSMDLSGCTIEEIPYSAFRNCFDLREFKFPKNLKTIGDKAFNSAFIYRTGDMPYTNDAEMNEILENRPNLDKGTTYVDLVIPEGVTYVGMWAFANETAVNDMENDPADTYFDELPVNYNRWGTSGVTYFDFYYSHLKSVVIPSTVQYLGRGAFAWCENLESVEFKQGFGDTDLRDYMFYSTNLKSAVFPEGIVNIEKAAFMRSNVENVSIPSTVKYIGRRAFAYTSNLETVTFGKGIDLKLYYVGETASGNYVLVDSGAIFDHSGIKNIEIPASVDIIPQLMFQTCERLTTVTFEEGSVLTTIRPYAFMNSGLETIKLPETIKAIGAQAFANVQIRELNIPAGLSNGDLSTGTKGGDENRLGWYAFADNKKLEKITFAPDCQLEVLSFRVFQNCTALKEVVLSNNLRSVNGTYAKTAYDNPETKDVVEGTIWTSNAFDGCTALERITVPAGNPYIIAEGYALYSRTTTSGEYVNFDWYSQAEAAGGELNVKDGIVNIYEYLFSNNKHITKLYFPASVKVVGTAACREMTSLEEIVFAPGSQLEEIGNYTFGNITTYPKIVSDTGFESTNYNEPPIKTPLAKIVFTGTVPPKIGASIFVWSTENPDFAIYVPAEAVDAYKAAAGLSAYAQYIKAIED